jgi:serine/threonine protein kinase
MLPLTPTKLGRYEIVDEIGKGAMGVVYLARDPLIGRLVALKTFRIGYSVKDQELEQFRLRFMREAQSAGILTHPNIVTIHDVVESSDDGVAFIAMEYVRGTNLKLLLQGDQPLSMQFVLDTIAQVGDALDYAHSNRVVHRDVKPANILITSDNRVKITDFGIARLDSSNLTQEGQLLGTPNYMAPEQIQGKEVDHRADLFSLGVVLYEMLTRHKPFQGENLTVVSHRIVYDHFTPLRDYVGNLPPGVDKILARALEKDPARRYQRAREMVDDLRRVVGVTSVAPDDLNETQSLSATMVLPPSAVPPLPPAPPQVQAAQAAKPSMFSRWRKPASTPPAFPAPVPPPPPMADPGTGTRTGTGADMGSGSMPAPPSVPVLPVPPAIAMVPPPPPEPSLELEDTAATNAPVAPPGTPVISPAAPAARGEGLSLRWLLVGVGTAALVVVLGVAAFLLWRNGSKPAPPAPAPPPVVATVPPPVMTPEQRKAQFAKLKEAGNTALRRGDWAAAAVVYQQAEQLDPGDVTIRQLREAAEQKAQEFQSLVAREQAVNAHLTNARGALATKRYDLAISEANQALVIDPKSPDAAALLKQARRGKQRATPAGPQAPGTGEEVAGTAPAPSEVQPGNGSEASPAEAATTTVRVHFHSDVPEGVLIVWVNGKERIRENFGGRLFQRKRDPIDRSWTLSDISTGGAKFRVHFAPEGRGAVVRTLDSGLLSGVPHDVEIRVPFESQQMTARFLN